ATTALSFSDVDLSDTHLATYAETGATWSKSGWSIRGARVTAFASDWSLAVCASDRSGSGSVKVDFALADTLADFLAAGETLTVRSEERRVGKEWRTSTKPVPIKNTSTNETPVLSAEASSAHQLSAIAGVTNG